MDEYYEIRDMFVPFNLPITIEDIDPQEIVRLTKNDKKMEDGKIKFDASKEGGMFKPEYNETLLETKDNLESKEYIETICREKLDMYYENEKVYININK